MFIGRPSFLTTRGRCKLSNPPRRLIVEISTPPFVRLPNHAHDVAAGVQREWPRFPQQLHVLQFAEQAVAFAAGGAIGNSQTNFSRRQTPPPTPRQQNSRKVRPGSDPP